MTVTQQQLAAIIAQLTDGTPPATRHAKPTCRATGCVERLDPALVDDKATNTGLHLLCDEPGPGDSQRGVAAAPDVNPAPAPVEPASTITELRGLLVNHEANSARSLQTHIGPSEIGVECQRALAYRITNTPEQPDHRVPWAPIIGTATHAYLADVLTAHNTQLGRTRWLVEERVWPTDDISGSGDAFDVDTGTVIDWKIVGDNSITKYRRRMRPEYRIQAHIYGLGHERAGRDVRWVRIVCLARSHDYDKSWEWTEPYDPAVAIYALDRLYATHDLINGLNLTDNPALWGAVPSQPSPDCRYCRFFRPNKPPAADGCPGDPDANQRRVDKFTDGLIAK